MLPVSFQYTQQQNGESEYNHKQERFWECSQDLGSCSSYEQMPFKSEFQDILPTQGTGVFSNANVLQHFGEEQEPGLVPFGNASITEAQAKQEMLAYQALCQAELLRSEKTPHRTQFQRENHILAERQRREEMNEKFTALKALLPKSTKKDKASIVGETINYVLDLEKKLKELQLLANSKNIHRHKRRALQVEPERTLATSSNEGESNPSVKGAEIEMQTLGTHTVIKMICMRSPGLALRILSTLEEHNAHVIQSNIATLGNHSILFFTVQLSNTSSEELVSALESAANNRQQQVV